MNFKKHSAIALAVCIVFLLSSVTATIVHASASTVSTGNIQIIPPDPAKSSYLIIPPNTTSSSPVSTTDNSSNPQNIHPTTSTSWEIDMWTDQQGSQLPQSMTGIFTAVSGNGLSEGSSTDCDVIYEPLNAAYGSNGNFLWFQLCVWFPTTGSAPTYGLTYWPIVNGQYATEFPYEDFFNTTTGQSIPYAVGDTYSYSMETSSSNTVTFSIIDTTANLSFSQAYTVPSATLLCNPYGYYSPASCVEANGFVPGQPFMNVPTFTTAIQNSGETNYYY